MCVSVCMCACVSVCKILAAFAEESASQKDVPLVGFMYLIFTHMLGEGYH